MRKRYVSPKVTIVVVNLEESIAAGSAFVKPGNDSNQIYEQWYEDDTQTKELDWNQL